MLRVVLRSSRPFAGDAAVALSVIAGTRGPPRVQERRDRLVNRRTTPVAPTVQVTIGRIEVRATPTPVAEMS